ncbi:MAG: class I SAM-dependent methyltransferase [Planctomycetes bacterium]|nr:class I SAM-dependent methyltransferase [Planctomycetota bacterium]
MHSAAFAAPSLEFHELVDSGGGEKLERYGGVLLRRPDPQALWRPVHPPARWDEAQLVFVRESDRGGRWEARRLAPPELRGKAPSWTMPIGGGRFHVRPTPFKHVGVFPEQAPNWELVGALRGRFGPARPRLLNLFGYTGVASVLAAQAGYEVTHVDASKTSVAWTRENAELSRLPADALRLIVDDAPAFARREVRRKARYSVVLLDPPHHGRGPKGETWQFEEHVAELVATLPELLEERALVVLSTYAIGCSPLSLENLLRELGPGELESGELVLAPRDARARALPAGFCARWRRGV